MPHQVVWEKINAGFAPGETDEETIVHRGGLLPDWVDPFTAATAVSVGAAKWVPEDALDPALTRQSIVPPPVRLPEHPADLPRTNMAGADLISAAGLEDDARQLVEEYDANAAASTDRPIDEDYDNSVRQGRPRTTDDKATWYEYRVAERVANRPDDQSEQDARAQAQADLAERSKAQLVAGE